MKAIKSKKAHKLQRILRLISLLLIVFFLLDSSPALAFLHKIIIPIEYLVALGKVKKTGKDIHRWSKNIENAGAYQANKIKTEARQAHATGQISRTELNKQIALANAVRNTYNERAKQVRRYGRSAGKYEVRKATKKTVKKVVFQSSRAGRLFQKAHNSLDKGKKALQAIRGEIDKALELVGQKSDKAIARLQRIRDRLRRHGDNLENTYLLSQAAGLRGRIIDDTVGNGAGLARALDAEVADLQNRIKKGEKKVRDFGERLKKKTEDMESDLTRAGQKMDRARERGINADVRNKKFSLAQFQSRMRGKEDMQEYNRETIRLLAQGLKPRSDEERKQRLARALEKYGIKTKTEKQVSKSDKGATDAEEDESPPFDEAFKVSKGIKTKLQAERMSKLEARELADSGYAQSSSQQAMTGQVKTTQKQLEENARRKAQKEADKKARDRAAAKAAAERKQMIAELKNLKAQGVDVNFNERMKSTELKKILADARKKAAEQKEDKEKKPDAECTDDSQCEKSHGKEYRCDNQTGKCVKKKPEPECTDDPQCVKLHGKDYRCDKQTGKCVKKKPEPECTDDPQCEKSRGPEYRCDKQIGKCVKKKCTSHAQCKAWKGGAYRCDFENGECVAECTNNTDCEKLYNKSYECKPPRCVQKKCTSDPQCEQWIGKGFKCDTQTGNCVEPAPMAFPRTYTGTINGTITATALYGIGGTQVCNYSGPMELTLLASGLVNLTIYEHGNPHFDNTGKGTRCSKYKQEILILGTHSKGILKFATGKGKYDENTASGNLETDEVTEKMAYGNAKFKIKNWFELKLKKAGK
jgi:hypothetical protein